ncbi:nickel pincer cofactor biosynthesis protein LarC [Glycomyces luteolus]|uniref:Pyridinium-3,5-bisthiocarboxylic acid mononucleotide nickel insertion protein n=1 Tax=Glycomyces luteolus TaxID=2670330 RepID=A0A9X3PEN6_9ACTN|nr:nickel pincer cofactor biosynthesis protein LarC [Glycomyces luteolus]MDA1362327.1 nickel pincer cofactor biosynthesis protein LarC [Glycomyces luteolus]
MNAQGESGAVRIAWLDCSAGASGDMFLGALVDAGVELAVMQAAVDALGTEPVRLLADRVTRHGLVATKVDVEAPEVATDRRWRSIRGMLEGAELDAAARKLALGAFARLAAAEAAAHGIDEEDVHFHEVGALDSIADIVGAAAGLAALGIDRLTVSTVTVGGGTTRGSHGSIPLPAPAVLRVLADAGAPVVGAVPYEACTPTGAAIIAAAASGYGPMPEMVVERIGAGAGGRDPKERANLLRLLVGREVSAPGRGSHVHHDQGIASAGHGHGHAHRPHDHDHHGRHVPAAPETRDAAPRKAHVRSGASAEAHGGNAQAPAKPVVIETNVDDLDPRLWPAALAALLAAGASDAWLTPILMKKGRPAHTVHVLCRPEAIEAVRSALVRHTTTIGMRYYEIEKNALERRYAHVDVDGHRIGVKIALEDGEVVNASVEYEDAAAAAAALGRPLKVVIAQATALAAEHY